MVQMSKIAQQLCNDIVEPAVIVTTSPVHRRSSSKEKSKADRSFILELQHCPVIKDHHGKATRSVVIEKQKVVKNIATAVPSGTKTVVKEFKSKDFILKKDLVDMAVNTVVTGSLRNDNHCNTVVRHRENAIPCKCGPKRTCTKPIQPKKTFSRHLFRDRAVAVAQVVETVSCGTQFLEKVEKEKNLKFRIPQVMATQTSTRGVEKGMQLSAEFNKPHIVLTKKASFKPNLRSDSATIEILKTIGGSNRWAMSKYPTMGPDF